MLLDCAGQDVQEVQKPKIMVEKSKTHYVMLGLFVLAVFSLLKYGLGLF